MEQVLSKQHEEPPENHYHNSGRALVIIGSVVMIMAGFMMFFDHASSEHDHVSNFLVGTIVVLTGIWLNSHEHEDMY